MANDVVVRAVLDDSAFIKSWANIDREIKANTALWKTQFRELSNGGDWVGAYEAKVKGLTTSIKLTGEEISEVSKKLNSVEGGKLPDGSWNTQDKEVQKLLVRLSQLQEKEATLKGQLGQTENALVRVTAGVKKYQEQYEKLETVVKNTASAVEASTNKYQANAVKLDTMSSRTKALNNVLEAQKAALAELKTGSDAWEKMQTEIAQTKGKAAELTSELKKIKSEGAIRGDLMSSATAGLEKYGTKLTEVGRGMTNFGMNTVLNVGIAGAALVKGAKEAADISHVYNVNNNLLKTSGESAAQSQKEVNEMQKQGRSLSLQYGESQKAIGEGYEELIRRGYDGKSALSAMNSIMEASKASGDSLSDTLRVTTSTLEGFGLRSENSTKMLKNTKDVANTLAFAADTTATDFSDMGLAMTYVSQSAHAVGYDISETASAIGVLSNNGVEGQKAGTGLRKVLTSLAAPTGSASEALNQLGVSVVDNTGKMKSLPDIFGQLHEKIGQLPQDEQLGVLKTIFGQTGLQAAGVLTNNFSALAEETEKVRDASSTAGSYIEKLAQANMKDPASQMKVFKATVDDTAMSLGKAMMPTLTNMLEKVQDGVKWFDNLSDGTKRFIGNTALLVGAIGGVSLVLGPVVTTLGMISTAASSTIKTFNVLKNASDFRSAAKGLSQLTNKNKAIEELSSAIEDLNLAGRGTSNLKAGENITQLGTKAGKAKSEIKELESGTVTAASGITKLEGNAAKAARGVSGLATEGAAATEGITMLGMSAPVAAAAILGVTAAVSLGVYAYAKHRESVQKHNETLEYNTKLSKSQAKEFDTMNQQADAASVTINNLAGIKLDTDNIQTAAAAYKALADVFQGNVQKSVDGTQKKIDAMNEVLKDPSATSAQKKLAQDTINSLNQKKDAYNNDANAVKTANDDIHNILNNAANDHRELTKKEKNQITEDTHNMMKAQIDATESYSKNQKSALKKLVDDSSDFSKLNTKQIESVMQDYGKSLKGALSDQIDATNNMIKNGADKGKAWTTFFSDNIGAIKPLVTGFNADINKIDWSPGKNGVKDYTTAYDNLKKSVQDAGLDWNTFAKQFHIASVDAIGSIQNWNNEPIKEKNLVTKDKTTQETLNAINSNKQWNQLTPEQKVYIAQDKASSKILNALRKSGEWDTLSPKQQSLILKDLASGNVDKANKSLKSWEQLKTVPKNLKANDAASEVLKDAGISVSQWNKLSPKLQKIVAKDVASGDANAAKNAIAGWNAFKTIPKEIKANDEASVVLKAAGVSVKDWNGLPTDIKKAVGNDLASGDFESAKRRVDIWNSTPSDVKDAKGNDSAGGVTEAKGRLDEWNGTNPTDKKARAQVEGYRDVIDLISAISSFSSFDNVITKTVKMVADKVTGKKAVGTASAEETGMYWLGDGGKNEPYMTPDGYFGVSPADWTLTHLPAGSKVWPSISAFNADTDSLISSDDIPKFATGGTIPVTDKIQSVIDINKRSAENSHAQKTQTVIEKDQNNDIIVEALNKMTALLQVVASKDLTVAIDKVALANSMNQQMGVIANRRGNGRA